MQQRICLGGRLFYEWAKEELSGGYDAIPDRWIQAIRPSKSRIPVRVEPHAAWELEDVLKIARLSVSEYHLQRAQAAICFLYLSGMRSTAFLTLPLNCVDIDQRQIEQNPAKGVITKNRKAAITTLLPIPELIQVVKGWDEWVRSRLPLDTPWFAYLDPYDRLKSPESNIQERVNGRRMACVNGMKRVCVLAGVPYKSPHKLRHGHAIFGIKHARDMRELKAISQNLMHSSISITDGIYGNLQYEDMKETIAAMGRNADQLPDLRALIQMLLDIQNNPKLIQKQA
jgi:integrase